MSEAFDVAALEWQPVRLEVARGVFGKTPLAGEVKFVLTRVAPGGRFDLHRTQYQ